MLTPRHAAKIDFLRLHGADAIAHSTADLLGHLSGVRALLEAWGARGALCDAGLFHSVYGTESFRTAAVPVALRPAVRALIGEEAEEIAHLFGTTTRASLFALALDRPPFLLEEHRSPAKVEVTAARVLDLWTLTVANWLEQRPRLPSSLQRWFAPEFARIRSRLSAPARDAIERAYGFETVGGRAPAPRAAAARRPL